MLVTALYEALDDLADQARTVANSFFKDGDITALSAGLVELGGRAHSLSNAADRIVQALKFED